MECMIFESSFWTLLFAVLALLLGGAYLWRQGTIAKHCLKSLSTYLWQPLIRHTADYGQGIKQTIEVTGNVTADGADINIGIFGLLGTEGDFHDPLR